MTVDLQWTLHDVARATSGSVRGDPATPITTVATDSRTAKPGSLFVAIRGERFDGHAFIGAATKGGSVAALIERGRDGGALASVEVEDTTEALRNLAVARRSQLEVPVIAITGSTGKTSTKDLLAASVPGAWASPRSYNNEVGVPLTVLATPPAAEFLVVEVGSRGTGHINWLAPAIRPGVAIITNLGVVHLETFGTTERLADAKWELVAALDTGGTAVLPADEPRLDRPHAGRTITFGEAPTIADVTVSGLSLDRIGRASFTISVSDRHGLEAWEGVVRLGLSGRHQASNAAAAAAAGAALGLDVAALVAAMEHAVGSPWRMEVHEGPVTVVNDAYNANPDSMEGALRTVAAMPGRHVAVLGRMAELGQVAEAEHVRIGRLAAELGYTAVIVVGTEPGIAVGAGDIAHAVVTEDEAAALLAEVLRPGDTVLVKASRAIGLESLASRLVEEVVA